jgi:hypothetical protein
MSTKSHSTTTSSTQNSAAAKPAKRKATKKPPVIDRAGVDIGSTVAGATDQVAIPVPSPGDTATTTGTAVASTPSSASQASTVAAPVAAPATGTVTAAAPTGTTPVSATVAANPNAAANTNAAAGTGAVDLSAVPLMNAPPTVSVPVGPAGFVPVPAVDLKGYRPLQAELACVPDAVYELQSFPNWQQIFGITAPPSTQVAARLQVAAQWTSLLAQSNSWTSYVKSQEGMAWKDALLVIDSLKAPFQLASAASPSMSSQYPALNRLLGAQKVVAKRAVSTKKKNAAANAATAAAATATAAPAATPTVAAASDASTTPARVVTVQG